MPTEPVPPSNHSAKPTGADLFRWAAGCLKAEPREIVYIDTATVKDPDAALAAYLRQIAEYGPPPQVIDLSAPSWGASP